MNAECTTGEKRVNCAKITLAKTNNRRKLAEESDYYLSIDVSVSQGKLWVHQQMDFAHSIITLNINRVTISYLYNT